jgi:hypothetical protein
MVVVSDYTLEGKPINTILPYSKSSWYYKKVIEDECVFVANKKYMV